MKAFITVFNRLKYVVNLSRQLKDFGYEVIIIDNHSTYKPLLEWLYSCEFDVYRMSKNYHVYALWASGLIDKFTDRYYISTDDDIDLSKTPPDFNHILQLGLDNVEGCFKAGLSLEINDLPKNKYTKQVIKQELNFWQKKNSYGFWEAQIGGTLAMYDRTKKPPEFEVQIRSPRPYICRHLPWYQTTLDGEDLQYIRTSKKVHYGWTQVLQKTLKSRI